MLIYFTYRKELGTVIIKMGPVPKFDYILNEILQWNVGFWIVLFS